MTVKTVAKPLAKRHNRRRYRMRTVCFCLTIIALFSFGGCPKSQSAIYLKGSEPDPVLDRMASQEEICRLLDSLNLSSCAEALAQNIQSFQGDTIHRDQGYWFYTMGRSLARLAVALQEAPATRRTIYLSGFEQGITMYRRQVCLALAKSHYREDQAVLSWTKQLNPQDSTTWSPPEVLLRGALE